MDPPFETESENIEPREDKEDEVARDGLSNRSISDAVANDYRRQ